VLFRSIAFALRAPAAHTVQAAIWTPPTTTVVPMNKDEKGIWRGASPALEPDLYYYHLNVDGVTTRDPGASWFKGDSKDLMCVVEVPGRKNPPWAIRSGIVHGALTHHRFDSKAAGDTRGLNIYTPPSYHRTNQEFPVLYLLHGAGGDETRWVDVGLIDRLMDNWIADGKVGEMVVAVTANRLSGGAPSAAAPAGPSVLERYFLEEVMPFVEGRYRVSKARTKTAVAGFSMGGSQTLQLALKHPDRFGALASLSGAIRGNLIETYPILNDAIRVNHDFPVFYVVCGEQDPLSSAAKAFHDQLTQAGIKHKYLTGPGGHAYKVDWPMMEEFLADFSAAAK
jgi:enterochelin esterase-like enzyme